MPLDIDRILFIGNLNDLIRNGPGRIYPESSVQILVCFVDKMTSSQLQASIARFSYLSPCGESLTIGGGGDGLCTLAGFE